ncbi:Asparagine synthetase glutamine-hydrolyzing [Paramagnetospirillum magnetotacticum MS-1]|uniref:asparagine synthase (glutamine-hydrolyzing) n=1 Tax=Paramagnetospirillum magnetotacticum MS-1 TaxID=272627 RepID=A0A0C2YIL3_PARME|nr:Asparagine synthetase glutamine-hydrolyzing [Paramagnetospirillum magnetotacticum MS-1]
MEGAVALGMRRLSVIDLAGGNQPIHNENGSISVVFNGEIYNFRELRRELEEEGHIFSSHTDTEVLVHLYESHGRGMLDRLNGMFAFCLLDRRAGRLFLARDRVGKKPLYYAHGDGAFAFASEIKSLLCHPAVRREADPAAAALYFTHGYVPAPFTPFMGIRKLPAGHWLELDLASGEIQVGRYWDLDYSQVDEDLCEEEAVAGLESALLAAVERRLISDVPLGVFLSGGVDSSLVVAMMARFREGRDIHAFSIGFHEKAFDESGYAESVARAWGVDHHVTRFSDAEMFSVIDEILPRMDEPLSDPSLIPTYLLSKVTQDSGIVVALSGDGADEMFGGYPKYYIHRYAAWLDRLPGILGRDVPAWLFSQVPLKAENNIFNYKVERFVSGLRLAPRHRNQFWVAPFMPDELTRLLPEQEVPRAVWEVTDQYDSRFNGRGVVDRMMYFDAKMMLQDMYLAKVDRASMAVSLEVRSPFLDLEVMDAAVHLPWQLKVRGRETKYLLKKLASRYLPHDVVYRFKRGFGLPLAVWMRTLAPRISETLTQGDCGGIDAAYVQSLLREHLDGTRDHAVKLWAVYAYLTWLRNWGGS